MLLLSVSTVEAAAWRGSCLCAGR